MIQSVFTNLCMLVNTSVQFTPLKRLSTLTLALSLVTLSACGGSGGNNSGSGSDMPESGPSPAEIDRINNIIATTMSEQSIPGIAVGVLSSSQEPRFWMNAFGVKSLETQEPVTVDTAFPLASVSKTILGTLLHKAQEQGFVNLEEDIRTYLAATNLSTIAPDNVPITFDSLGYHASGIVDVQAAYQCTYHLTPIGSPPTFLVNLADLGFDCSDDSPTTLENYLEAYLNEGGSLYSPENFSGPFGQTQYSNLGAALAGFALEQGIGESLESFSQREVFAPLNMQNTSWFYNNLNTQNIASAHFTINGEKIVLPQYELATWPDGGLKSSARDMLNFLAAVMNDGVLATNNERILREESVIDMLTPAEGSDYGAFWFHGGGLRFNGIDYDPIWGVGGDPGVFSIFAISPSQDVGAVILINGDNDDFDMQEIIMLLAQLMDFSQSL